MEIGRIKIGPMEFTIEAVNDLQEGNAKLLGKINSADLILHVDDSLPKQAMEQTIWHESLHAILEQLGQVKHAGDESLVDPLAYMIYLFVQNNKQFILAHYEQGE